MKILILGGDGYLGWPTAMFFSKLGHKVTIIDNFLKKKLRMKKMLGHYLPKYLWLKGWICGIRL